MRSAIRVITAGSLLGSASAIWVAQNSPCSVNCGNVLTDTTGSDMSCASSNYRYSTAGTVFQNCVDCELTSNYTSGDQTDLQWLLYNVRYSFSYCLFGDPNNTDVGDTPCITSTACGPLKKAIEHNNLTSQTGAYDYCADWIEVQVPKCSYCLTAGGSSYLNNYLTILDAACAQKPAPGATLSIQGTPFSTIPMNITTPTPSALPSIPTNNGPISLGGKVGIAFGGLALILAVAGCCIVCNGKRRRRAFLRQLEKRHQGDGWPHPSTRYGQGAGGPEMFETPVSQKPLTGGWGDSPISAVTESTEKPFGRYFSPYSSQFNSPVSAVEGPSAQQWPTLGQHNLSPQQQQQPEPQKFPSPAQERVIERQLEAEYASGLPIGVALGGDEASLRSKGSLPQMQDAKDKGRDEAYEMHEVDSAHSGSDRSGRYPANQQTPVIQPPIPGRHSPPRPPKKQSAREWFRELNEEDARSGRAL